MEAGSEIDSISALGQELKQWEKLFATQNKGRKPTRQDIKQDTTIAAKYKQYQSLRDAQNQSARPLKKRKLDSHQVSPAKPRNKHLETPSKSNKHRDTSHDDENCPPTPGLAFIGPTPQKDGHVLGLFDLLQNSTTPSKRQDPASNPDREALQLLDKNTVIATPTKSAAYPGKSTTGMSATPVRHLRTPQSSEGKRFLLNKFVTPSKRRNCNDETTPQSHHSRNPHSATPAFLTRNNSAPLPQITEHSESLGYVNPITRPGFRKRGLTRSLSSMIAEMRQAEEERLEEEMDLLRELEESAAVPRAANKPTPASQAAVTCVEHSQANVLLGPDGSKALSDDEGTTNQQATHQKTWKKKGQKRQTRKFNLKPATATKKNQDPAPAALSDIDEQSASEHDVDPDADYKATEHTHRDELDDSTSPLKSRKQPTQSTQQDKGQATQSENVVRKAAKKISATAHANFRRLKIKSSKGAKAAGGANGRFGRRRR